MGRAATLLNGQDISKSMLQGIADKIQRIHQTLGSPDDLTLATLQVGDAKDVTLYSKYLKNLVSQLGISYLPVLLPETVTQKELVDSIRKLNKNPKVAGVMIFSPLPKMIDSLEALDVLDPKKDVEGRTFLKSHFGVFSPTANSVIALIEATQVNLVGKEAVVVGHSDLVGKPIAVLLADKLATVTICHRETKDLESCVKRADVLVSAVGVAHLIKGEWVKPGSIVIDVGENELDGHLVGDVEFEPASRRAGFISPVPGGVGPLTNVMLIQNLLRLYDLNQSRAKKNATL